MPQVATRHVQPGFWRRVIVTPGPGRATAEVEDDFHCMGVALHHDGHVISRVQARLQRAPWTTCPGAIQQLEQTFMGVELAQVATRGEKKRNCTHLHDMAVLAAAHALDTSPLTYDLFISDPCNGSRHAGAELNGKPVLEWTEVNGRILEPAAPSVVSEAMRAWIDSLSAAGQEAARLLRWASLIAHGRTIPMEKQSDASRMPIGNCYTFQPERVTEARRVGEIRDFNSGSHPLERNRPFTGLPEPLS